MFFDAWSTENISWNHNCTKTWISNGFGSSVSWYLTTPCRFYQCANATENSNLVMKADAVINATVLFKKERLRKISCNDRAGDNVIKL